MQRTLPHRPSSVVLIRLCCLLAFLLTGPELTAQEGADASTLLRGRVEALRSFGGASAARDMLLSRQALPLFYEARAFRPAWTGSADLDALARATSAAETHGLDAEDYHQAAIASLRSAALGGRATPQQVADLDLLATDAFLLLGSHLLHGRVNPETIDPEWLANRRTATMQNVLTAALRAGDVERALASLAPRQARYRRMLEAAQALHQVDAAGGWPVVTDGSKLESGVEDDRVPVLRQRLRASGDLAGPSSDDATFDQSVEFAVRRFQTRHGLDADGVVGPATLAELNVPARERARRIEVNLERWRWLPADLGSRHLEVNIAGFEVKLVEDGSTVRTHRAVVGRQYRQTPMFTGSMTYLVLAPYWHVPPTIAAVDKLPLIKADPGYLSAQRMTLLDQRTNEIVDPASVDWQGMSGPDFNRRYRLRQEPGPANALGSVKFMFPNRHNVYLHDTPSRELFGRASRDLSSGCVRTENPLDLAAHLLSDQPEWSRAAIDAAVARGVEQVVRLTRPVPVHLLYWTAWADEDGTIQFRPDVYGRDDAVWRALDAPPPGP